jgi:hypothetical protein
MQKFYWTVKVKVKFAARALPRTFTANATARAYQSQNSINVDRIKAM